MNTENVVSKHKYVVLNNSGSMSPDGNYDYCFWFLRQLIRLIGDRPFSRGDLAEIVEVNPKLSTIRVRVLGDPATEKMPADLPAWDEIPGLIFVSTKIYLNDKSDYTLDTDESIQILMSYTSIIDGNKAYAAAVTMVGSSGKITGHDSLTNVKWEWLLEERGTR